MTDRHSLVAIASRFGEPADRAAAVDRLREVAAGEPAALLADAPTLVERLLDGPPRADEIAIVGALARADPEAVVHAVPSLVEALGAPDRPTRGAAARALAAIGRDLPDLLPSAVAELAESTAESGPTPATDEPLATLAGIDPDYAAVRVRVAAVAGVESGDGDPAALLEAVAGVDPGAVGPAVRHIAPFLAAPNPAVQARAVETVVAAGSVAPATVEPVADRLADATRRVEDPEVVAAAEAVLEAIGHRDGSGWRRWLPFRSG